MPDDIDHEDARRTAALRQPNHVLAQPYLDLAEKLDAAYLALRAIGDVAAEDGEDGSVKALREVQGIAANALPQEKKVLPFTKLDNVSDK
jgi:hypothetical protein